MKDELAAEKAKAVEDLTVKEKEVEEIKAEMKSLIQELTDRTKMFQEKETETENIIATLRKYIQTLTNNLESSGSYIKELEAKINELMLEIEILKQRLQSNRRFKMFVDIKREVNDLKEQNEELQHRVEKEMTLSIPMMTSTGRMTSPRIRALSADPCRSRASCPKSSRPKTSLGRKRIAIEDLPSRLDVDR